MSEYQYYEFQAVDRPLSQTEMSKLRALSTRATITSTRFQNVYHYGDFKGDPLEVVARYFDAFVYVANWGTHQFMLRLPARLLSPTIVQTYTDHESLTVHHNGDFAIVEFISQDEEGGGWIDDEQSANWLPGLLPLRHELANGDFRALYLGWLASVEAGMRDDDETEPPVPAGLGSLSASLVALAEFTRVSDVLLAAAAQGSPDRAQTNTPIDIEGWIRELPIAEKDALLTRLVTDNDAHLGVELRRSIREGDTRQTGVGAGTRTVGELLSAAEDIAIARRREEAERNARDHARVQRERAAARATYLDSLVGREDELWRQVDTLVETKRPKEYDQAVQIVQDLNDLSVRDGGSEGFTSRLGSLRDRVQKRPSFIDRLNRAGLSG